MIENAATVQPQPIRIRRLVAQASLLPLLLRGQVHLEDVLVDGGVLPQLSLRGLRVKPAAQVHEADAVQLDAMHFSDVVWITRHGLPLEFSGSARFGPGWQLRDAEVVRPGVRPVARLALTPLGDDRWTVDLQVGGGSANGQVVLKTAADGALALSGQLAPSNIDLRSAPARPPCWRWPASSTPRTARTAWWCA